MSDTIAPSAWLVVDFQSETEQSARIVAILSQLEIPADLVGPGAAPSEPPAVAVRVPTDRVVAAVLALEEHGFRRVRAYGGHPDQ